MLLTEGQMSDYKGAALMFEAMPPAPVLLTDRGYDADWFRQALAVRGTAACIPSRKGRKTPIPQDAALYRGRHRIENMFGHLKDWRRIHTRYDRCAHAFMSAIAIAASVIFWINQWVLSLRRSTPILSDNVTSGGAMYVWATAIGEVSEQEIADRISALRFI